jgi:hypothetical protein
LKKKIFKRSVVCGIAILFIGLSTISNISGSDSNINNQYTFINPSAEPLGNNLKAHWNFDEGSGSVAHDQSGNGYDGTIHGATWTNGHSVYALNFNGIDSYVEMDAHSENLGFNKEDNYEISAWIQTETTTDGIVYSISNTNSTLLYADISIASNGSFIFRIGTVECTLTVASDIGFNDGEWHFVEGKWYGSPTNPTMELYVDSELEATLTKWQCPFNADQFETAKIGRRGADEFDYFEGIIDEVKVYWSDPSNTAPDAPIISGEKEGKAGTEYEYTFNANDDDGDEVRFHIDWGDGEQEWTAFYPEETDVKIKHTFKDKDTFTISAYAQDSNGANGDPTNYVVTMPKTKGFYFNFNILDWILDKFPYEFLILRNLLGL